MKNKLMQRSSWKVWALGASMVVVTVSIWQLRGAATTSDDEQVVTASRGAQIEKLPRAPEGKPVSSPLAPGVLAPGVLAPDFVLPDQNGKRHRLSELRGKTVVPEFYPQDNT